MDASSCKKSAYVSPSGTRLFVKLIAFFSILIFLSSCHNIFFDFARKDHLDMNGDPGGDIPRHIEWIVIFDKNGGDTEAVPQMMAPPVPGESLSRLPAEPGRANHIFTGWNTAPGGGGANFDLSSPVSARTTVYAQWEALNGRLVVTFAGNGARIEAHPRQMAAFFGTSLGGLPSTPQRDGYNFTGWNTIANGTGSPFDGSTPVYSNIIVYAQWERPEGTHVVIFNSNGGTYVEPRFVLPGGSVMRPTNPSMTGYLFDNWYRAGGGTYSFGTPVHEDIILHAAWTPITYNINYISNGVTGGSTTPSTHTYDVPQPLSENGFTAPANHVFDGWSTQPGGGGAIYANMQVVVNLMALNGTTLNLYARWRYVPPDTYLVQFDTKGGYFIPAQIVQEGGRATPPPIPTKTGYDFDDWYTNDLYPSGSNYSFSNEVYDDLILYAKWNPLRYVVTYDPNGGTFESYYIPSITPEHTDFFYNEYGALAAPATPPAEGFHDLTRANHTFVGWNTQPDGSGVNYGAGQMVMNLTSSEPTVTLYAKWVENPPGTNIVVFDSNGGNYVGYRLFNSTPAQYLYPPDIPVRTGYIFRGWYTDTTWSVQYTFPREVTDSFTLYAMWDPDPAGHFTIIYDINSGTGTAPTMAPVPYATPITLPSGSGLSRTGYTFNGWNTSPAGTGTNYAAEAGFTVTGNRTLYARWVPNTLTINYAPGAGSVTGSGPTSPTSAAYGANVTMPSSGYIRTGYTLSGWAVSGSGAITDTHAVGASVAVTSLSTTIASGNAIITLTAQWTLQSSGGSGTASDPFLVYDIETLRRVGRGTGAWIGDWSLSAHYRQTADITLPNLTGGQTSNFTPIGDNSTNSDASRFTGSYNGNGYGIFNMIISRPGSPYTGMFGSVGTGGLLNNIDLSNINITGGNYTGGLVGYLFGGTIRISHVSLSDSNKIEGALYTGGLVGGSSENINIEANTIDLSGAAHITGTSNVGGLLGHHTNGTATITSNTVNLSGNVIINGASNVGGLLGHNIAGIATITGSHVNLSGNAKITGTSTDCHTGGMAGYIGGSGSSIVNSSVIMSGNAQITGNSIVGGLVGYIGADAVIRGSYVQGLEASIVSGINNVGGIAGNSSGSSILIENCYANTAVMASGNNAGGLVGQASNLTIINCYAAGSVTVNGNNAGGLAGLFNSGTIGNNVALNPFVTGGSALSTARITGNDASVLFNNYARVMQVNGSLDYLGDTADMGHDRRHGLSIVPEGTPDRDSIAAHLTLMNLGWWQTSGFDIDLSSGSSVWIFHPGGTPASHTLPTLRNAGGAQQPRMR